MYALTRALQFELSFGTPANNFGNGTASAYRAWGEMEMGTVPVGTQRHNIVPILQGVSIAVCMAKNSPGNVFKKVNLKWIYQSL